MGSDGTFCEASGYKAGISPCRASGRDNTNYPDPWEEEYF
jgi:hypothetical protein